MENMNKAQMIPVLRAGGKRNRDIAEELGCSRQYVHQVLRGKSRPRPHGRAKRRLDEELLTVTQAAEVLGVAGNTMRRWTERGLIDSYRIGPRKDRRFKMAVLTEYLETRKDSRAHA